MLMVSTISTGSAAEGSVVSRLPNRATEVTLSPYHDGNKDNTNVHKKTKQHVVSKGGAVDLCAIP